MANSILVSFGLHVYIMKILHACDFHDLGITLTS